MIAYLEGKLTSKSATQVHLDVGGLAYEVNISLNTYSYIEEKEEVKLFTYLHVKEDSHTLYGFLDESEKQMFKLLISVSGIGPNTARVILSYMNVKEVQSAILNDNVAAFKKVKGVGPKTAKLIILDLKEKVAKTALSNDVSLVFKENNLKEEALAAFAALGFQKTKVEKLIDKILVDQPQLNQVESIIKAILRQMS